MNPGNDKFQETLNSAIYVDKTELIAYTNSVIHGCHSEALFSGLKISSHRSFHDCLNQYDTLFWNMQELAYSGNPPYYNFETIDGDYFAAYPGIDKHGIFTLFGDDSSYTWSMNEKATECAYRMARQARFEHGETPGRRRFR